MLAPVSHNLALTTIIRKRLLPVQGEVVVKLNQHILATDTVAEAEFSHKHHLIDIAHILGIKPSVAEKMVSVRVGEKLAAGTVVAKGIKVEHNGRVVAAGGGQILLDISEKPFELKAGISGEVVELIQNRGVIIQEVGALVQGIWGNGRISSGTLHVLAEKPAEILTAKQLDMSLRSLVILAGSCQNAEVLNTAAEITVRGLILSSIHPSLLGLARKMPYPIVVTDAIGNQAMNANAYKIISTNNQREKVTVNAEAFQRYEGTRPEIIIPLPHTDPPSTPRAVEIFAPGQKVRLRRAPHAGATGTLENLPAGLKTLPNGLRVMAGEVKLNSGKQITVPLVNLEVLG
ncbi:MAG: hypothetical protein ISR59_05240 [Anaerolineales bacterium]|uniref:KOW domain-containing protein n=1 Tax=Candidatus Desulfolinea nitratireducens TaxID=2841698 RepID=A0A8J6NLU1_9CHLR|nr:hypothetical protein [Candidatus Desulfolinea nitratireducens]MBL6960494.1 hypothetical protein [Anaerolineales bacterium]